MSTHSEVIAELIEKLESDVLTYYEGASESAYRAWTITAGIAFLSSVASALTAALISDASFGTYGKSLLVVIPVIGAAATGLLHLYKFREKEALREEGRIEVEDIILNAKSLLSSCTSENDAKVAFQQIRERYRQLELNQHRRDITLRSDEVPKIKP